MRQLALALVVACGACGSPHHATPDAAPVQLDLDVVVASDFVYLFTNGSDLAYPDCVSGSENFPVTGSAVFVDDVWQCTPGDTSCFSSVSVHATTGDVPGDLGIGRAIAMQASVVGVAGATLEIDGCGSHASIPIGGSVPPVPTATASVDTAAHTITVTWSASPAAPSALLAFMGESWTDVLHVPSTSYAFTPTKFPVAGYSAVRVQPLALPTTMPSPYGEIRVWTGDVTFVNL